MELSHQKRDDLKSLLEDHTKVTDALMSVSKTSYQSTLTVRREDDDDFTEVELHHTVAKKALAAHKEWVEAQLLKLGVTVADK